MADSSTPTSTRKHSRSYPWGRTSPARRIEQLEARIRSLASEESDFEVFCQERRTAFARLRDQLEHDLAMARNCEHDRLSAERDRLCARLRMRDIEPAPELLERTPDADVIAALEQRLRSAPSPTARTKKEPDVAPGARDAIVEIDDVEDTLDLNLKQET